MPGDFPAIDWYKELVRDLSETDDDMISGDQRVPQVKDDVVTMPVPIPMSLSIENDYCDHFLEHCTSFLAAPSVGRTTVTEVADQEVTSGSSPTHILELDACSTLYDTPVEVAKELAQQSFYTSLEEDEQHVDENLALFLAMKDIDAECSMMDLTPDPKCWSSTDVSKWVRYMSSKYDIKDVSRHLLQMGIDGVALCRLSEDRSPVCSEQLYAQLEIWWHHSKLSSSHVYQQGIQEVTDPLTFGVTRQCPSPFSASPGSPESSSTDSCHSSLGSPPRISSDLEESVYTYQKLFKPSDIKKEPVSPKPTEHKQTIHLWQFLKELLYNDSFRNCIRWINKGEGIFKIEDSSRVAKEWGRRKNRPAMNYDKLSRSIRQYYKKAIIKKTEHSKRLVYQFCVPYL